MQFLDGFKENLLHAVFCLLFIFQVFHAHTKEKEGIPLQQYAEPLIIVIGMELCQQFLI